MTETVASVLGEDIWNHPICDQCWFAINPKREPMRQREPERQRCCWCGQGTMSGILRREDPWDLPKHTTHRS